MPTAARTKRGRVQNRRGRPTGYKLSQESIERIRASINTKLCIETLHSLATNGGKHDGVRATAALGLLRKVLPDLSATDLTSDGESIVIERAEFKRRG